MLSLSGHADWAPQLWCEVQKHFFTSAKTNRKVDFWINGYDAILFVFIHGYVLRLGWT